MPERTRQKKPMKPKPSPDSGPVVWGAYRPDIFRSYPDPPVRGRIVNGKFGKEFRPDPGQLDSRHKVNYNIKDWITGTSYDNVVEIMRETADEAIKALKAGIDRLERFIDKN